MLNIFLYFFTICKFVYELFTYNNSLHSSIGATPFQVAQGIEGSPLPRLLPTPSTDVDLVSWWSDLAENWDLIEKSLDLAKQQHKRFADRRRGPNLDLQPGDFVYISTKNLRRQQPTKKLAWKYLGPFEIDSCINDVALRLKLPKNLKHVHPVFHHSLLKKAPVPDRWHP